MNDMNPDAYTNSIARIFSRLGETGTPPPYSLSLITWARKSAASNQTECQHMEAVHYISYFFGGVFLANAVPHFVSGITGHPFQSPFAKPPGEGLSSSTVNVLWGFFNLIVGYILICRVGDFDLDSTPQVAAAGAGALLLSLMMARHFGRFHGGNSPKGS
jgi:hypothetical protein